MAVPKKPTGMKKGNPVMPAFPPKRISDPISGQPLIKGQPVPAQNTGKYMETAKQFGRSVDDALLTPLQKKKAK